MYDTRQMELLQLQREYRHMEMNRRAYTDETQATLRTQLKTIEKLRSDNDDLRNDIAAIMRSSSRPLTISQQHDIHRLHEQREKYYSLIDEQKTAIESLEDEIDMLKQKVLHQRKSMGGVNATKENHYMIEKQIRILENRLEKALLKFNESMAQHKALREKIDDLRRERVVFENLYRKMERELLEKKKQMSEIIEMSNQAYEARDTYQMEIAAIESANRKEQEEFEEQMVELGRLLDTELALPPAPIRTKSSPLKKSKDKNSYSPSNMNLADTIIIESSALDRVQNFEDAFNKIKESTGITGKLIVDTNYIFTSMVVTVDVDELVRIFIKNEDHNFSLFNYVNEQNNEIEASEEQIQALKEEEQRLTQESGDDVHHHKQVLRDLESKLQSTESLAEKYDSRCVDLQRSVESLKREIQTMYELTCTDGGSDVVITESNMVQYLGIIEQRTNSLMENYSEVKQCIAVATAMPTVQSVPSIVASPAILTPSNASKSSTNVANNTNINVGNNNVATIPSATLLGPGPKVPPGQEHIHVNPPKLDDYNSGDEDEEEEDDTRPFTLEELKVRTLNRLQRKGQGIVNKQSKKQKNVKSTAN